MLEHRTNGRQGNGTGDDQDARGGWIMAESQMRGYVLQSAVGYLRKAAGEQHGKQLLDGLSPETKTAIATAKEATWVPLRTMSEVHRAIASLGNGDESSARTHLIESGKYSATEASNTFLKLLMKLLTPVMFAKKLPDFWRRDCNIGKLVVDVNDERIRCRLEGLAELDHVAPVAAGYVTFALEAMGKTVAKTEI